MKHFGHFLGIVLAVGASSAEAVTVCQAVPSTARLSLMPPMTPEVRAELHDRFNLACIAFINVINFLNWRLDTAAWKNFSLLDGHDEWASRWTGDYEQSLLVALFAYMVFDTLFVCVFPQSVKTPGSILLHHVCVLFAMLVPLTHRATHGYTLGLFLVADLNTLFLTVRKMLLKSTSNGPGTVVFSMVSFCFYITWVVIRLIIFPIWLFKISVPAYLAHWHRVGTPLNVFIVMPCSNFWACALNFKWTYDLGGGMLKRQSASGRSTKLGRSD